LLLGYYTPDGKLIYAGRVGTGMPVAELERL
jgi:ATP-dependent DNA ligase